MVRARALHPTALFVAMCSHLWGALTEECLVMLLIAYVNHKANESPPNQTDGRIDVRRDPARVAILLLEYSRASAAAARSRNNSRTTWLNGNYNFWPTTPTTSHIFRTKKGHAPRSPRGLHFLECFLFVGLGQCTPKKAVTSQTAIES